MSRPQPAAARPEPRGLAAVGSGWALGPGGLGPARVASPSGAGAGPQPSARVCRTRRANRAHRVADGAAALVNYEYEHPARPTPGLSNDRTNVSRRSVASIRSSYVDVDVRGAGGRRTGADAR